jgi:hypothetical protein
MKEIFQKGHFLTALVIPLFLLYSGGQGGNWSISGGVQYLKGDYIYTTSTSTFYLTGGIRYQTERWNMGIRVPAIFQDNELLSGSGGMFLPAHRGGSGNGNGTGAGHHGGGMHDGRIITDDVDHHYEMGLGDLYFSGQYQFITQQNNLLSVAVTGQVKIPTASTSKSFGTGELDYSIILNLSKRFGDYAAFLDTGYWVLGDSPEINYRNAFIYGIGIGRFFNGGEYSVLIYYQGYTTILPDFDPPRQGSLGLYYRIDNQTFFSVSASAGFSDTSPDLGLALGVNRTL